MASNTSRILYLHTGTWKTGSTALQAHLNVNSARLAELGVSYVLFPNAEPWEGNATTLCGQLLGQHVPSHRLIEILQAYLGDRPTAICSSENFTSFRNAEWTQLLDAASHLQVEVRTITYLRDIAPYYQSMHAQAFKGGEHYCDLAKFSRIDRYATVVESLRSMLENFGGARMTVAHYESTRGAVDGPLMAALGIDPSRLDGTTLEKPINRSLTGYEMRLLAALIEKTGQQFANDLSNFLLRRRPDLKPDYLLDQGLLKQLRERHQEDLKWVNDTFFAGAETLRIADARDSGQSVPRSNDETQQAIDRDVASWCIDKMSAIQDATIAFVAAKMSNIDWGNIGNPALPADFDPIAYLILNADVLKAGVPPCAHFLTAGQHEAATRRWRWQN